MVSLESIKYQRIARSDKRRGIVEVAGGSALAVVSAIFGGDYLSILGYIISATVAVNGARRIRNANKYLGYQRKIGNLTI